MLYCLFINSMPEPITIYLGEIYRKHFPAKALVSTKATNFILFDSR